MKHLNRARRYGARVAFGGAALLGSALALAGGGGGTSYAAITDAVDWADVTLGVVAIAAIAATVYVAIRGTRMMLAMIKST